MARTLLRFTLINIFSTFVRHCCEYWGLRVRSIRWSTTGGKFRLEVLPIGIAPGELGNLIDSDPETGKHLQELRQRYRGQQTIIAVDRLDYTKGIPQRMRTYRRLLTQHTELREKVVLIQVAVPSREGIGDYQDLRSELNELVGEINGDLATAHWTPDRGIFIRA